jgi:hypothetical protein
VKLVHSLQGLLLALPDCFGALLLLPEVADAQLSDGLFVVAAALAQVQAVVVLH